MEAIPTLSIDTKSSFVSVTIIPGVTVDYQCRYSRDYSTLIPCAVVFSFVCFIVHHPAFY